VRPPHKVSQAGFSQTGHAIVSPIHFGHCQHRPDCNLYICSIKNCAPFLHQGGSAQQAVNSSLPQFQSNGSLAEPARQAGSAAYVRNRIYHQIRQHGPVFPAAPCGSYRVRSCRTGPVPERRMKAIMPDCPGKPMRKSCRRPGQGSLHPEPAGCRLRS